MMIEVVKDFQNQGLEEEELVMMEGLNARLEGLDQ
jgi:hypothetical protein